MPHIDCQGRRLPLSPGQSVLDALLSAEIAVPASCRAGACQACLVQATRGTPPPEAQQGLKESLRLQGYFLACQARPQEDLEVSLPGADAGGLSAPGRITSVTYLAKDVLGVQLETEQPFECRAGQYVTLLREDGLARAYSIAARGGTGPRSLELHVRVLATGRMSGWLASPEAVGAQVRLRGPQGECFYVPGNPAQPLALIGTGTGLAPLWGVLRDALASGHSGAIELWHGARNRAGLYLTEALRALARAHAQLSYRPCVLEDDSASDAELAVGSLDSVVLSNIPSFAGRRVYLCGDPGLVQKLKRQAFLKGASLREIHADAFVGTP